ncbi:hypothetical protein E4T42_03455 [Aureobasidium subglaciale]|nr:hypothetical protein E4T42_03455 [Aureobasidium subglaciale]
MWRRCQHRFSSSSVTRQQSPYYYPLSPCMKQSLVSLMLKECQADSPISTSIEDDNYNDYEYHDSDDPKSRISNITATSISSFPESTWPSDSDVLGPYYSTTKPRPAYRVGSLRPSPSSLRPSKHTSRRARSREERDKSPRNKERHVVRYEPQPPAPLVLLHVSVLPPRLPWNRSVLDATLSSELKRQFGVLRAATSGLVAQRGILIAHPRDEFELLEEGVLEALDLLPERIDYDGQYRPRTPGTVVDGEEDEVDSELKPCETCQRVHTSEVSWYTRVYAANGLMRAGAWAACWSEMERVDVEVRPCISEELCQRLDDMQSAEQIANERQIHDQDKRSDSAVAPDYVPSLHDHLPLIYQPKDVPLGLVLRNYINLVLQNRRNVVILSLVLTLLASITYGISKASNQTEAIHTATIPPSITRIDVGHGKRHPMWTKGIAGPQNALARTEKYEMSKPGLLTAYLSEDAIEHSVIYDRSSSIASSATSPDFSDTVSSQAVALSPNPVFLSLLDPTIQYCPKDSLSEARQ